MKFKISQLLAAMSAFAIFLRILITSAKTTSNQMENKKYELTDDIRYQANTKLHRIRALRSFRGVRTGDLGGYIEKEDNLAHAGNCWVTRYAVVRENARVSFDALVSDNAEVSGNADVSGRAIIGGSAKVFDSAKASGDARVTGRANAAGQCVITDDTSVLGRARIYGSAVIKGSAHIAGGAYVLDNACVSGRARVAGDAVVGGRALVCGDAIIHGQADIHGDAMILRSSDCLFIQSKYAITLTADYLDIGCQSHTVEEWLAFSDDDIAEMDHGALSWWQTNKEWLMAAAAAIPVKRMSEESCYGT